jgi:hypothetical protein
MMKYVYVCAESGGENILLAVLKTYILRAAFHDLQFPLAFIAGNLREGNP